MSEIECWIPPLFPCNNLADWKSYEDKLYDVFSRDWLHERPTYKGLPVEIRYNPKWGGREEGFWHLTCRDYDKQGYGPDSRNPDPGRCEHIEWPKALIENFESCMTCLDEDCAGVLTWCVKARNGRLRHKFLIKDERYLVVLEQRKRYFLLITAFELTEDCKFKSSLREYEKNKR